jgi:hypothetical protein
MNIAKRTVPLNSQGHRLEFDYNQGLYRLAFYFPEYDAISGRQTGEQRVAIKHPSLNNCLTVVFGEADDLIEGECQHDPLTVEQYMRSQPWGRELPK